MKPEDVKTYYGTNYKFAKATKMSASTLANWLKWGFVPEDAQYKLERITKGELKPDEPFDKPNIDLTERYERERKIISSFTAEQIDHICYQIGEWYLGVKLLLESTHNLGYMKEKLKKMICGE